MKNLPDVTLVGIDCLDVDRLIRALDISCRSISFGAVKLLTSLPTDDARKVAIDPLLSIDAYSEFCLASLHEYVDTPYVLIVQHDGFVLNPDAWDDAFLSYDYIGAPIELGAWAKVTEAEYGQLIVGNGGFSLRSQRLLTLTPQLLETGEIPRNEPEDWAQCYTGKVALEKHGIRFAPPLVAEQFSFEGRNKHNYVWEHSFGFHSLRWTDIGAWLRANPADAAYISNKIEMETLE